MCVGGGGVSVGGGASVSRDVRGGGGVSMA